MTEEGGRGGGSLALDDVTFYHHFLKLNFFLPVLLLVLVLNFGSSGRSQITSSALEGGVFKL